MPDAGWRCRLAALAVAGLPCAAAADVADDARACAAVADAGARLACYDALFRPASRPSAESAQEQPAQPVPATPAAVAETEAAAAAELGADDLRRSRPAERATETTAVIVSIQELRSGARLFELDNGQTWREKREKPGLRLSPGDEVRIKAGSLGSYKLFGGGKTSTSVERVR